MDNAHVAALIEDFRAQFRVFGEAVQGTNDKIDALDVEVAVNGAPHKRKK